MSLREAMHTPAFWGLVVVSAVGFRLTSGLALNQVAIFVDLGYPASLAALTFTVESIAMFGVTLGIGAMVDRYPLRYSLALSQILLVVGMAVLLMAQSFWLGAVYAALRGASMAIIIVAVDVAWPAFFGRKHLGSVRGFGAAIAVFGTSMGPLPFGFAYDAFGSYAPAILALLVLPTLAGLFVLTTRPPALEPVIA